MVPAIGSANAVYSIQRYQPFRGSLHARAGPGRSMPYWRTSPSSAPLDPPYGYTEQIVPPGANSPGHANPGDLFQWKRQSQGDQEYSHTLGWANEFEQGSLNSPGRAVELVPVQRP